MYILGINSGMHDSSVCLIKDGQIEFYGEEERFSRVKHTKDFPRTALRCMLDTAGISINDIEHIGYFWKPWRGLARRTFIVLKENPAALLTNRGRPAILKNMLAVKRILRDEWGFRNHFHYLDHHLTHCSGSFFVSPFEKSAILSLDANGEVNTAVLACGHDRHIRVLDAVKYPNSLGLLYLCVTEYLGFRENWDEGKVMALAAYGSPVYYDKFKQVLQFTEDGKFRLDTSYFDVQHSKKNYVTKKFIDLFGPRREKGASIEQRHMDIAASVQNIYQDALTRLLGYLYKITKLDNLCFSGGLALNSVANGLIAKRTPFERIYIPPTANDCGTSIGAAFYIYHELLKQKRCYRLENAYLGPEFSDTEIEQALDHPDITYQVVGDIAGRAAELIANGKYIGWFQGKMEAGPRALGNRSILADPRNPEAKTHLNRYIKHREDFQPYAPSVLEERASEFFRDCRHSPFMLKVYQVLPEKQKLVPAVVHIDGTARVQTVSKASNPLYWELIKKFEKITGIPMVLNTSFNLQDEPIVCSPQEAVDSFRRSGLDFLVIGNYLVKKGK